MKTTTDEIIYQLKQIQLLANCELQIALNGVRAKLEIKSVQSQKLADCILGIARMADSYGLSEVTILPTEGQFLPLTFPTSALEFYKMDAQHLEMIRERAIKHQALLNALPNQVAVYLHATEEPFTHLDARVEMEERMNVPMIELLGSPVHRLESQLAELRDFYLRRAVSTGAVQVYQYTHHWSNLDWRFECKVAPLAGTEEAIAIITDLEPWQRPWWVSRRARAAVS